MMESGNSLGLNYILRAGCISCVEHAAGIQSLVAWADSYIIILKASERVRNFINQKLLSLSGGHNSKEAKEQPLSQTDALC